MIERIFHELVGSIENIKSASEGSEALREIISEYGLSHAAYLGVNIPTLTENKLFYVTTYSDAWCEHYVKSDYVNIDPVVKHGLAGLLPFDWNSIPNDRDDVRRLFNESYEHGLGKQGLSFPIRGAHGETALFTVNCHASDSEWESMKSAFIRDFQILAYHFHTHILETEGVFVDNVRLSKREHETLKWAAAGKTTWETGVIMGVSETTVKFFIENARTKLAAVNKTQAVAKAIKLGLI